MADDLKEFAKRNHERLSANPDLLNMEIENKKSGGAQTDLDVQAMKENGYVIIPNLLTPEYQKELRQALEPHLNDGLQGRNRFEGYTTQRVYGMLAKSRSFDFLVSHPRITSILDRFLLPNWLLTAFQCINIMPGEKRQPFHYDDQFMNIDRPHRPFSIATIWAIDDFTAENGGTVIIPKSHTWGWQLPTKEEIEMMGIPVVMPAGSVVVFLSTLWHGGGANVSQAPRCAVSAQYCEPWIRPQENMQMVVPYEMVDDLPASIQTMIGYSIHPPFIGHVNGLHPFKTLQGRIETYGLKSTTGSSGKPTKHAHISSKL